VGDLAAQDGRFEPTSVFPVDAGVEGEPVSSRLLHLLGVLDAQAERGHLLEQPGSEVEAPGGEFLNPLGDGLGVLDADDVGAKAVLDGVGRGPVDF
jgi:hypothetical protein